METLTAQLKATEGITHEFRCGFVEIQEHWFHRTPNMLFLLYGLRKTV